MKPNKICVILVIFLVTFAFFDLAFSTEIRQVFEKTYDFQPQGTLILKNTNGTVTVESWRRNEIEVRAIKKVKAGSRRDAELFMEKVRIEITRSRDRLRIETDYPQKRGDWGFMSWMRGRRKPQVTIEFDIKVPEEIDLDLGTVNGAITVWEINGEVEVHTTNGRIELDNVYGSVKGNTVNGSIEAELKDLDRRDDIRLETVNGTIITYFPRNIDADFNARAVNGSIRTDFPLKVRGKWGPKNVSGIVGRGGALINLKTVNGSIKILER